MRLFSPFGRLINPEDKERDVKLLAYGAVALFGIVKLSFSPIDGHWVDAFYGLCALVGLGGTAWAAVDKWKGGQKVGAAASPAPGVQASASEGNPEGAKIEGQP